MLGKIVIIFALWLGCVSVAIYLAPRVLSVKGTFLGYDQEHYDAAPQLFARHNFDGNHYTYIALRGYGFAQTAFFPLYPLSIALAALGGLDPYIFAVLLSNICFFLSLCVIALLTKDKDQQSSLWIIIALATFPTSFYFSAAYTESLFLLLVVGVFWSFSHRKWFLVASLGALASATRLAGLFLIPALFLEIITNNKLQKNGIAYISLACMSFGFLWYIVFLWSSTGDPLSFIHAQQLFGQDRSSQLILLPQVFWRYLKIVSSINKISIDYLTISIELLTGIVFSIAGIWGFKRHKAISLFSLLVFLIPTFTGSFVSLPRYVLLCLAPLWEIGKSLSQSRSVVKITYIASSSIIGFILALLFFSGHWVS